MTARAMRDRVSLDLLHPIDEQNTYHFQNHRSSGERVHILMRSEAAISELEWRHEN